MICSADTSARHPWLPIVLAAAFVIESLWSVWVAFEQQSVREQAVAAYRGGAPVKPLELTPVRPVASQGDFFAGTSSPVYPDDACARGDALKTYRRFDRGLGEQEAARMLGITAEQLRGAEVGAYAFDLDLAKRMLRGAA